MLRLIRIVGSSMEPTFRSGDLALTIAYRRPPTPAVGHVVLLRHPVFGPMVKRVCACSEGVFEVAGDGVASTASTDLGPIRPDWISARVVCRIGLPRGRALRRTPSP